MSHPHMVLACIIDRTGELRNIQVLEAGPAEVNGKVLSALSSWKFRPAERGGQPVEVTAILGFNIDTR
jgi:TonB family protein